MPGAHWDGAGVNFALFSAHAERVELCIYDTSGKRERERITLPECTDQIWQGMFQVSCLVIVTAIVFTVRMIP